MKDINAEIIAVGTELLLGQIANTNAQWISQQLALEGINVLHHDVVGDNLGRVYETFKRAGARSDVIIITGGLGPTDDDLTREAFQRMSQMELIEDDVSMNKILDYYKQQEAEMTSNNRKQARVFDKAQVIENKTGMAPGMIVFYLNKLWIFMPGVPREMKQMMGDDVIPYLRSSFGNDVMIKSKILRFIGIGESKLEDELKELITEQTNPTIALLAQSDGIIARLTAKGETNEQVDNLLMGLEEKITSKVGDYIYGVGYQTIEKVVVSMLKEKNITISAAESLTGGMFTDQIIANPGASQISPGGIVAYSPEVKNQLLGVPLNVIETKGTVSSQCAIEMASRVRQILQTQIGISFTGVAGPDESEGHKPGIVYIGLSSINGEEFYERHMLYGNRDAIRKKAALKGFEILYHFLKNQK